MSKRMQVLIEEALYERLQEAARRQDRTVADVVRESIQAHLAVLDGPSPEERLSRILAFSVHSGPTGDIETLLAEIEAGASSGRGPE